MRTINNTENRLKTFSHTSIYKDINVLQETVGKLENDIMETKRLKILRDVRDYNEKSFYEWRSARFQKTQRSIQRKKENTSINY